MDQMPVTGVQQPEPNIPVQAQGTGIVPPTTAPRPQIVLQDQAVAPTAPVSGVASPPPGYFTAEDVEKARRQEKEKLYRDIERYRAQVSELQDKIKAWEEEREALKRAEEEAARRKREEEMELRQLLQETNKEWEQRFAQLQAEREAERAALEKEKEFARLQSYIQKRAREERDANRIAPELIDLINGNTVDEVEASIEQLRQKTEAILQNVAAQVPQAPARGVSPAGYTPTGPMENQPTTYTLTPEEIRSMSMADYAKIRPHIFGKNTQSGLGKGLFG